MFSCFLEHWWTLNNIKLSSVNLSISSRIFTLKLLEHSFINELLMWKKPTRKRLAIYVWRASVGLWLCSFKYSNEYYLLHKCDSFIASLFEKQLFYQLQSALSWENCSCFTLCIIIVKIPQLINVVLVRDDDMEMTSFMWHYKNKKQNSIETNVTVFFLSHSSLTPEEEKKPTTHFTARYKTALCHVIYYD